MLGMDLSLDSEDLDMLGAEGFGDNMVAAYAAATPAPSLDDVRSGRSAIRKGMKGESVKYVQQRVGLKGVDIDGDFGSKTFEAVRKFQGAMLIDNDGIVNKTTLEALDGVYVIPEKAGPVASGKPADKNKSNLIAWILAGLAAVGIGVAVTR